MLFKYIYTTISNNLIICTSLAHNEPIFSDEDDHAGGHGGGGGCAGGMYNNSYDTHNIRSLHHYTREALPRLDHYRNVMSVHGHMNRPTLDELHNATLSLLPEKVS